MSGTTAIVLTIVGSIVVAFILEAVGISLQPKRRYWDDEYLFWYEDDK